MHTLANRRDLDAVAARLSSISLADRALWGRMTSHGMVCHLADSYCLGLGSRVASSATSLLQRTVVKSLALYAPLRWPKNLATRPEVEQGCGGTVPVDFEGDRARLLSVMHKFAEDSSLPSRRHPIFGSMTQRDWLRWGYLHADHHLRQFGR
jgi:hypothetical protein